MTIKTRKEIYFKSIFLTFFVFFITKSLKSSAEAAFFGKFKQGEAVIGHITEPLESVLLDGEQVPFNKEGWFVLGFDREAKSESLFVINYKNKAQESKKLEITKANWDIQRIEGLEPKKVTPPKEELERIKKEEEIIAKVRENIAKEAFFLEEGFAKPLDELKISSVYGSQRILNGIPKSPHFGIDFAANKGVPVYAIADGIISLTYKDMYYSGNVVMINHGLSLQSIYIHLDKIKVSNNQKVKKGEIIGLVGSTGRATGPHLHLGVSVKDKRINPLSLLNIVVEK